jgi:hypothetical protein
VLGNLQGQKAFYKTTGLASAILKQVKAMQSSMASLMGKLVKALPVCDSRMDFVANSTDRISPGTISRRGQRSQSQHGGGIPQNSFDIFVIIQCI